MGPAYVGICLPSTCEPKILENFLNEKLNETLGGLFKPMGSKILDEIKDAVYTSEPRPFTTGDIVTMYVAHSAVGYLDIDLSHLKFLLFHILFERSIS